MVEFMKHFIGANEHVLFDGSSIISNSEKLNINRLGYNAHGKYDPQINLLYAFGCETKEPGYYRIIPGNIRDVSAFKLSIAEADLQKVVVIGDKGFGSEANFKMLDEAGLKYIVPLKRNSSLFKADKLKVENRENFDGYFMFDERPIWYYKTAEAVVFVDNDLKNEEEKSYLKNIENNIEGYAISGFWEVRHKFGSIAMKTNLEKSTKEIYYLYKERGEIEQAFDFLKNLLEQDKSYMQNEKSLESWAFMNHVSLMLVYRVYNLLREKQLLSKFSVSDFLSHLKYIFKIRINGKWHLTESTKKTKKFLEILNIHIT
jgi:transposase